MNTDPSAATDGRSETETTTGHRRRRVLVVGASVGATLLAGCTSGSNTGDGGTATGSGGETATTSGAFRLLISDQPVAIDEFDSLDVTLDRARVFRAGGDDDAAEEDAETANATAATTANVTATATTTANDTGSDEDEDEESDDGENGQRGFSIVDLDGATVDLTTVVGDRAITVFNGELPAGRYTKIELYAADVAGVVDGEGVDVTIPSGKLQITKPFEVGADEPVDFVFDINVVKRGQSGGYNLLPVIAESGVAGADVNVTEVGDRTSEGDDGGQAPDDADGQPSNTSQSGDRDGGRDATATETDESE